MLEAVIKNIVQNNEVAATRIFVTRKVTISKLVRCVIIIMVQLQHTTIITLIVNVVGIVFPLVKLFNLCCNNWMTRSVLRAFSGLRVAEIVNFEDTFPGLKVV